MASSTASTCEQDYSKIINQGILSRIQHLNVTELITDKSREAVAYGGNCEVFTGNLRRGVNGQVCVAIKRLRFHTGEERALEARPSSLYAEQPVVSHGQSSNSPKKFTYGQSCPTQTSYRY